MQILWVLTNIDNFYRLHVFALPQRFVCGVISSLWSSLKNWDDRKRRVMQRYFLPITVPSWSTWWPHWSYPCQLTSKSLSQSICSLTKRTMCVPWQASQFNWNTACVCRVYSRGFQSLVIDYRLSLSSSLNYPDPEYCIFFKGAIFNANSKWIRVFELLALYTLSRRKETAFELLRSQQNLATNGFHCKNLKLYGRHYLTGPEGRTYHNIILCKGKRVTPGHVQMW